MVSPPFDAAFAMQHSGSLPPPSLTPRLLSEVDAANTQTHSHARRPSPDQAAPDAGEPHSGEGEAGPSGEAAAALTSANFGSAAEAGRPFSLEDLMPGGRACWRPVLAQYAKEAQRSDPLDRLEAGPPLPGAPRDGDASAVDDGAAAVYWQTSLNIMPPASQEATRLLSTENIPAGSLAEQYLRMLAGASTPPGAAAWAAGKAPGADNSRASGSGRGGGTAATEGMSPCSSKPLTSQLSARSSVEAHIIANEQKDTVNSLYTVLDGR
jgi:hypothetical protein